MPKLEQRIVQVTLRDTRGHEATVLMLVDVEVPDTVDGWTLNATDRARLDAEDAAKDALRPFLNNQACFEADQVTAPFTAAPRSRRELT